MMEDGFPRVYSPDHCGCRLVHRLSSLDLWSFNIAFFPGPSPFLFSFPFIFALSSKDTCFREGNENAVEMGLLAVWPSLPKLYAFKANALFVSRSVL